MNYWLLTYIGLTMLGIGYQIAKHGETKKETHYNFWTSFIATAIVWFILYMAGLFTLL